MTLRGTGVVGFSLSFEVLWGAMDPFGTTVVISGIFLSASFAPVVSVAAMLLIVIARRAQVTYRTLIFKMF